MEWVNSVAEYGFLVTAAGMLLLLTFLLFKKFLSKSTSIEDIDKRYSEIESRNSKMMQDSINKLVDVVSNDTLTVQIQSLASIMVEVKKSVDNLSYSLSDKAKDEATFPQLSRFIDSEMKVLRMAVISDARLILKKNNVKNHEDRVLNKITCYVNNAIDSFKSAAGLFKYQGLSFDQFVVANKLEFPREDVVKILFDYIYDEMRNEEKLELDLDLILVAYRNKLKNVM